jgi:hypothetical protein
MMISKKVSFYKNDKGESLSCIVYDKDNFFVTLKESSDGDLDIEFKTENLGEIKIATQLGYSDLSEYEVLDDIAVNIIETLTFYGEEVLGDLVEYYNNIDISEVVEATTH